MTFTDEADARKVLEVLPKCIARFGLRLHLVKTRLVQFVPPDREREGEGHSFVLLGFTDYWGRLQKGRWVIKRKTATDRLRKALMRVEDWCGAHRYDLIKAQYVTLTRKLQGHYGYYGIIGNRPALYRFRLKLIRLWVKWLGRRSQRRLTWRAAIPPVGTSAPAGAAPVASHCCFANVYHRGAGCVNRARPDLSGISLDLFPG